MRADGTRGPRTVGGRVLFITCPRCSTLHEVETWTLLDVRRHPDLRERMFSGCINMFDCSACSSRVCIELPLMYVDSANGFSALYLPADTLSNPTALLAFDARGRFVRPALAPTIADDLFALEPHVVFSLAELIRYVEFREALREQREDERLADHLS